MNKKIARWEFLKLCGGASAALMASTMVFSSCEESTVEPGPGPPLVRRVEELINRMSLDEKIHMVHGALAYEIAGGYIPPISGLGIP